MGIYTALTGSYEFNREKFITENGITPEEHIEQKMRMQMSANSTNSGSFDEQSNKKD